MTTYNGWTRELTAEQRRANELRSVIALCIENPGNLYWHARLFALAGSGRRAAYLLSWALPQPATRPQSAPIVGGWYGRQ